MKKIYYYLVLKQKSPLRLSDGDGEETDSDIRLDSRGLPYIPGTSLAGVLRSFLEEEKAKRIFGDIDIPESVWTNTNVAMSSRVIVSDAVMAPETEKSHAVILNRDGVGLDDWGQAIKGAKYDFQAIETDRPYYAVLEWTGDDAEEDEEINEIIEPLLRSLKNGGVSLGARTTRGYGEMAMDIRKKVFTFPEQVEEWLSYYPLTERFDAEETVEALNDADTPFSAMYHNIRIEFVMHDSFNIRVNTARAERLEDGTVPDSIPLMDSKGRPVIPGTAWAGAFRHHMHRILRECNLDSDAYENEVRRMDYECFGLSQERGKTHIKSRVHFSETTIEGGNVNTIMRNAVDRFTAAPKNTGLFTNQVWTGGTGALRIRIDHRVSNQDIRLILAAVYDLGHGLLTIGGEAGIGRGVIGITNLVLDGQDKNELLKSGRIDF